MTPLHPSLFVGYALAVLAGFAFGYVLERAGFGNAKRLAAQFYLTDMRVLKVMFTAVVTAAIGLALLRAFGLLAWDAVFVNPTFLGAQAVGGLIFGVGFVVGGHCPGTAVVSVMTGRINGLVFLLGVMLGALGFAGVYPQLEAFANAGGERVTLDQWLGLSFETTALLVTAAALAMFAGAELLERWMARRTHSERPDSGSPALRRGLALAALSLGALAAGLGDHTPVGAEERVGSASAPSTLAPFELARVLREAPPDAVVWTRGRARHAIGGPMVLSVDSASDQDLEHSASPAQRVILAFADALHMEKLAARLSQRGLAVSTLSGGLDAWDRAMDVDPNPPLAGAAAAAWDAHRAQLALRQYFGGERAPRAVEVKTPLPLPVAPAAAAGKKREGC